MQQYYKKSFVMIIIQYNETRFNIASMARMVPDMLRQKEVAPMHSAFSFDDLVKRLVGVIIHSNIESIIPLSKSRQRFIVILLLSNSPSPASWPLSCSPAVLRVSPQLKSSNFQ